MTPLGYADRIRALPREDRLAFYRALPPGLLASQRYSYRFWADERQRLPGLNELATIEVIRGGRRRGKTWCAVQLFNQAVLAGRFARGARLVAATNDALRDIVINGPSGVRTWLPPDLRPRYVGGDAKGKAGRLVYPKTALGEFEVLCLSVMNPGQAIGQGAEGTLYDDPAKAVKECGEARAAEVFRQLRVSNSEGRPCLIVPTTQIGVGFLRRLFTRGELRGVHFTELGGTALNKNLSPQYIRDTIESLRDEDGEFAAGEFDDEDRAEEPGALWRRAWIEAHRVAEPPELVRVLVAVDPADDDKKTSDEVGVVVLGLGSDERVYVLADLTARHSADVWPAVVAWAFRTWRADGVVVETNRGAGLVRRLLRIEAPHVPIQEVQATRGKATRAEPGANLYRDGRVSHVRGGPQLSEPRPIEAKLTIFDAQAQRRVPRTVAFQRDKSRWTTLEDELCGWAPRLGRSPNGVDALTWGIQALCPADGDTWAAQPEVEPVARAAEPDPYRYQPLPAAPVGGDGWDAADPYQYAGGGDPLRYT